MIIFVPISILLAIAASPESLHMLTANSDKNAIPVIFISRVKKVLLIDVLFASVCSKFIIPVSLSITSSKISTPVSRLMYIANSGLYCFKSIIIINAIKPIPIILITSKLISIPSAIFYKLNIVLTVPNKVLISFITIVRTITNPR